ncbi:MAG: hypothetical protein ABW278_06645 [Steroidobacteraceae bacterium]
MRLAMWGALAVLGAGIAPAGAAEAPAAAAARPAFTAAAATLRFATATQRQIDDEPRFSARLLRDTILAELTTRGMLGEQAEGRVVDIQIDEFSLRNTTNVVVFGNIASAGKLAAVLRIPGTDGGSPREARVRVEASLNLRKDDASAQSLEKLYRRFAVAIADELAGAPLRP